MPQPLTCAGKEAFSRVLAAELAPRYIRGICIRPHAIADAPAAGSYTKDLFKTLIWYRPGSKAAAGRWLQGAGVRIVLTPVQAPNANAYAERFVRSIRQECLDRLILLGEGRLLRALDEFVAHYHRERNHQGLGNELIIPATAAARGTRVRCRDRLGGLLRYYHRAA
jgi:transposase InsO family protein